MNVDAKGVADDLRRAGIERVVVNASLAELTTLRVGGPAGALVIAESTAELAHVARLCHERDMPWLVVGRGSNLLVDDAGFSGVAIQLGRGFRQVTIDGVEVSSGAAQPLPALARQVAAAGLKGFAWAAAVPGSLGGAVRMNAGAHGGQMADHLRWVDVFDMESVGERRIAASEISFGYRTTSIAPSIIVVEATLEFARGDAQAIGAEIDEIRAWRRAHQPLNEPNCGSVFVNPPGESAGRLIEEAGCKGLHVGGAQVSEMHANFVVTRPGATAADVRAVIEMVQQRVRRHCGVDLQTEVVTIGKANPSDAVAGEA